MRLGTMFCGTISRSLLLIFISSFLPSNITAQPSLIKTVCSETAGNFISGSLYQSNLDTVLTVLTTRASVSSFHNTSSGTDPDSVFGLYYCRFLFEQECQECIQTAAQMLQEVCPTEKQATAYYMGCTLRYANHSIFSVVEETPVAEIHSANKVPDPDEFGPALNRTMNSAIQMAAFGTNPSLLGLGVRFTTLSSGANLSSVAQCSLDVTGLPCSNCLSAAFAVVPGCCAESQWTWIFLPSCDVEYILTLPNDTSSTASPPPLASFSSPPPPPVTPETFSPPPPSAGQVSSNAFVPGNSGNWILNCGGGSVRFGLIVALIMIVL